MYAGALTCAPSHESALQNAGANAINRGDAVAAVAFFERAYAHESVDACSVEPGGGAGVLLLLLMMMVSGYNGVSRCECLFRGRLYGARTVPEI